MRILIAGDIVGAPGRRAFAQAVARLRGEAEVDFIVANAENAAAGKGLTPAIAEELFAAGADVLTTGDHVWDQKELAAHLNREPRILRPANAAPECPGRGWITRSVRSGPVTVINLCGRVFLPPLFDCPFRTADAILRELPPGHGPVIVDVHAEATSEKIALGWHLDGRVSAVVGTHTHVQTADETVLPKGTAYLTDLGMCGPRRSVLGREIEPVLRRFRTGMPQKFEVATEDVAMEGALIDVRAESGRAVGIRRVRIAADRSEGGAAG